MRGLRPRARLFGTGPGPGPGPGQAAAVAARARASGPSTGWPPRGTGSASTSTLLGPGQSDHDHWLKKDLIAEPDHLNRGEEGHASRCRRARLGDFIITSGGHESPTADSEFHPEPGPYPWFDMATTQQPYLLCVRNTLTAAMCIQNFACQEVERHNKPEVEVQKNSELLLNPVVISRNENEAVLIEPSINSVRLSIKIKKSDDLEEVLVAKFMRFLMQRADRFFVLRRKPIKGKWQRIRVDQTSNVHVFVWLGDFVCVLMFVLNSRI